MSCRKKRSLMHLFQISMLAHWRMLFKKKTHSNKLQREEFYPRAVSTIACRVDSLPIALAISHIFCNLKEKEVRDGHEYGDTALSFK